MNEKFKSKRQMIAVGFVGKIAENETKYIDSYITADVLNAKDIIYEIME
jgi:hypothetical protein